MADNGTAVKNRFPDRTQAIDELLARNQSFRDICADYARSRVQEMAVFSRSAS
ncbi:hypothetical protein [Rhizobium indicum]|uniref:hypothetical protein n=1 Tax=Rhizobium indicum TaxID=2583231 RepID=UPI0026A3404F